MRRRVRQRLMVYLVASSLLLAATCVFWAESVIGSKSIELWTWPVPGTTATEGYAARSERGRLEVYRVSVAPLRSQDGSIQAYDPSVDRLATIPYWAAATVCAACTLACWWLGRWHVEALPGACRNCGYDLRASPKRCPECGTPI